MYRMWPFRLLVIVVGMAVVSTKTNRRPNVVVFIADDLGIGDVGCFGNKTIPTPYLDKMADEGAKLTQHFAAASFCSPSRAALLTGRYPIRSGMAPLSTNLVRFFLYLASSGGLPSNETTIGELAKSVGYKTAYIGKWHLGLNKHREGDNEHGPNNQGFDYYYGIPWTNVKDFGEEGVELAESGFPMFRCRLLTMAGVITISLLLLARHGLISYPVAILLTIISTAPIWMHYALNTNLIRINSVIMRNTDVIEQPMILKNLTQRFVWESVQFLEERKRDQEPFLLVVGWQHVHTHIATNDDFTGKSINGRYGDGVMELDWGTGQVLKALDERGLGDNTFSYFSSDNGPHLEETGAHGEIDGGSSGIYTGGKTHGAVEGAIRVPTIIRWPTQIPRNTVTDEPSIFMDVLPTIANIIGAKLPGDRIIDGKDLMPLLTGKEKTTPHKFMVHYCGDSIHAARYRPDSGTSVWKLVYKRPNYLKGTDRCLFGCTCYDVVTLNPPYLHDITKDPSEQRPIDYSHDGRLQGIVDKMLRETEAHRQTVVPVPNQLSRRNLRWNPLLQPCCGTFPFCSCVESL